MLVAVGVYFGLRNIVGAGDVGWMCILAAFPFAMGGFFTYNGTTFEKFLLALIRSELLYPKKLVFRSENLYAKALENSSKRVRFYKSDLFRVWQGHQAMWSSTIPTACMKE